MKKPLDNLSGRQGSLRSILQQSSTRKQLVKQIRCHNLTGCLTILENSGYTNDLAVFILANLQTLEGENCYFFGGELRLNVTCDRQTKSRYLSAGWCDFCLSPWDVWSGCSDRSDHLLRSPNLTLGSDSICALNTDSGLEVRI